MASMPPGTPPPNMPPGSPSGPPPGYDPRAQRQYYRDQARAQRAAWRAQRMQWRWQMSGMRRASVVGPLLLIGIGIVFLMIQTGRIDRHEFFVSYAHWWPLVLVGAGLVVLAEWAFDQFHMSDPDRPQYRRSIGGGVVVLLLLLAFTGICADTGYNFAANHNDWRAHVLGFDQDSWDELFGDKHEFDQTLDLPLPADGAVTIVNPRGDVSVSGTSDDDRIHIAEHKTIYAGSDSEAEDRAKQLAPQTTADGSGTRITVASRDGAHADLTVTVPAQAAVTVNANRGAVHVSSLKGAVTVTANHGDIELAAISGPATAHINSSGSSLTARALDQGISIEGHANEIHLEDVTGPVTIDGEVFGSARLERTNGSIHFHTGRADLQLMRLDGEAQIGGSGIEVDQAQGPFVLSTSNRNVTLDRIAGDIAVTDRNGSVELTAAPLPGDVTGNITIEDRNGSVRATLPDHAGFAVQANTSNGNIDTNLRFSSGSDEPFESGHNERTLTGVVGSTPDAPTVHITTANGDISIMKGDVEPLAAPASAAKITMAAPPGPAPKAPRTRKAAKAAAVSAAAASASNP